MAKEAVVLRYGHRVFRDERVTSHCCLVARAFGAKKIIIVGGKDKETEESVKGVNEKWGGKFRVEFTNSWTRVLREHKNKGFLIVHLTMYGLPIDSVKKQLQKAGKVLLIVGSQKVEREVYEQSDLNVSITQQPHSEIAALAIALDRVFNGREMKDSFPNSKLRIVPSIKGKIVERVK